jgi:hypothetical protein
VTATVPDDDTVITLLPWDGNPHSLHIVNTGSITAAVLSVAIAWPRRSKVIVTG